MKTVLRRVVVPLVAVLVGLLPGVVAVEQASALTKMTHAQATAIFRAAGITWSSSGNCSNRNVATCTSFDQINDSTVYGVRTLKTASGCAVNITGGTETGHASGTYSHWNGYKVDIAVYTCVSNYIRNTFTRIADRGDGAQQWKSGAGNIYANEGNHWDITYYNCGGC
ncbi:hypothetical protein PWY87_23795 [Kribbella solani]|uniref:hypothetical protein n=1 Tax=Kribbella solani TaxID=236067 RepID=UPI0029A4A48A|nr:hypothetical protein [Kribbella solani]MDX3004730.1 hypothetical protein [Kribbella solani]